MPALASRTWQRPRPKGFPHLGTDFAAVPTARDPRPQTEFASVPYTNTPCRQKQPGPEWDSSGASTHWPDYQRALGTWGCHRNSRRKLLSKTLVDRGLVFDRISPRGPTRDWGACPGTASI